MNATVLSDLHLGSRHLNAAPLVRFLRALPPVDLVLNGDIVNRRCRTLPPDHEEALDIIRNHAESHRVIWIRGNHDPKYVPPWPSRIEFVDSYAEDGIVILHGHDFRNAHPRNRPLIMIFRILYLLKRLMPAEPLILNPIVLRLPFLQTMLRRHVTANAVQYAKEKGKSTVICGHTHLPEECVRVGIRYFNCGSWIFREPSYIEIRGPAITLHQYSKAQA